MDQLIRESRSFMRWYGRNIPIILLVMLAVDYFFLHFKQVYSLIVYLPVFAVVIGAGYKKKKLIESQLEEVYSDFERRFGRSEEDHVSAASIQSGSDPASAAASNHNQASTIPANHDPDILSPAEARKHLDELNKQTRHFCKGFGQGIQGFLMGLVVIECLRGHLDDASIAGAFSITFIMAFFLSRNLTRTQNQVLQDFSRLESENLSRL